jgi:hypothetical protein
VLGSFSLGLEVKEIEIKIGSFVFLGVFLEQK